MNAAAAAGTHAAANYYLYVQLRCENGEPYEPYMSRTCPLPSIAMVCIAYLFTVSTSQSISTDSTQRKRIA